MDPLLDLIGPILAKLPTEIALIVLVGLLIWRGRAEKQPPAVDTFREDVRVHLRGHDEEIASLRRDVDRLFDER